MKKIIDCITGEVTLEELSANDIKQEKIDAAEIKANKLLVQAEAEAKATARQIILDRLGLTADEAKLLLG